MEANRKRFSAETYHAEHGNKFFNQFLRDKMGEGQEIADCRKELYDYSLARKTYKKAIFLVGGAGSGKTTIAQSHPLMKKHADDPETLVSDHAGENTAEFIKKLMAAGTEVEIHFVACPLSIAIQRNKKREKTYDEKRVLGQHLDAQEWYMENPEELWGKKGVSFHTMKNFNAPMETAESYIGDLAYTELREHGYAAFESEDTKKELASVEGTGARPRTAPWPKGLIRTKTFDSHSRAKSPARSPGQGSVER